MQNSPLKSSGFIEFIEFFFFFLECGCALAPWVPEAFHARFPVSVKS